MTIVAFTHARGGSKRCPRKNVRLIANKPLIAHTILQAHNHPLIDRHVISTDDDEIAAIAHEYGAFVLRRPSELCSDSASEFASWKFAIESSKPMDIFVNLPCTTPLREAEDITKTIMSVDSWGAAIAFTVKKSRDFPLPDDAWSKDRYCVVGACYATTPAFIRKHDNIWGNGVFTTVTMPDERTIDIDTEHDFLVAKLLMENK